MDEIKRISKYEIFKKYVEDWINGADIEFEQCVYKSMEEYASTFRMQEQPNQDGGKLQDYLKRNLEKGVISFVVATHDYKEGNHWYIHPNGQAGETFDIYFGESQDPPDCYFELLRTEISNLQKELSQYKSQSQPTEQPLTQDKEVMRCDHNGAYKLSINDVFYCPDCDKHFRSLSEILYPETTKEQPTNEHDKEQSSPALMREEADDIAEELYPYDEDKDYRKRFDFAQYQQAKQGAFIAGVEYAANRLLNSDQNIQECDASKADSSNADGNIKI